MTIRFGVLGLDHWYNAFPTLEALKQQPDVDVVALTHRDAERAREAGERFGVAVLPSYDDVLGRGDVDAVCIFTSTDDVADLSIRALEAGKAVVAIKPMAIDLAAADRVVEAVRRTGGRYFPNDAARRFFPANAQFKGWIEEGKIGDLLAVHQVFRAGLVRRPGAGPRRGVHRSRGLSRRRAALAVRRGGRVRLRHDGERPPQGD